MRLVLLPVLLGLLSACATVEDVVQVPYTVSPAAPVAQAQKVALSVVDGRSADRQRISTKINGFGMEMAAIRSAREVPDIVRDALAAELQARGFAVTPSGRPLTVTIDQFYNQYHVGAFAGKANGQVRLAVSVGDRRGGTVFSGTYAGESEISIELANGSNAAESVATALKSAIIKIFADPAFLATVLARETADPPRGAVSGG